MTEPASYWLGIDTGGTFTDIVLSGSDGQLATHKLPSTADDYARGILDGVLALLASVHVPLDQVGRIVHGTTVATNAILEGKGAATALVTTAGFRDVLELRRIRIPELYNLFYEKPPPLVPRRRRFEVAERLNARGEIDIPLDETTVDAAISRIRAAGAEAVAVCLLHSYANPVHERRVAELLRAALPDVPVSCSADILPEIREYERTSTTVINAYVLPKVRRYLDSLQDNLRTAGAVPSLEVMQSSGGVMSAPAAAEQPVNIIESGPAAGVIAAARFAADTGYRNLITLDIGGTTAKASMIEEGAILYTSEYEVGGGINLSSQLVKGGGYALKLPVIDISEIGAGGGSIVWVDNGGSLRVGPHSAGSSPGPACYGAGGDAATVTDANLLLGYLNPRGLAGGSVPLRPDLAERAVHEQVATPLAIPLPEASLGVFTVAAASMMRALKAVSTYRGRDPRDCALFAFGGNGPVFAVEVARALEMTRVLVPPAPGVFSAFGLLQADVSRQVTQTYFHPVADIDLDDLNHRIAELEAATLAALAADGQPPERIELRRLAELRYSGQAYELSVPLPAGRLDAGSLLEMIDNFGAEHLKTYGHHAVDEAVDLVNIRVIGRILARHSPLPGAGIDNERSGHGEVAGARPAYFGGGHGWVETPILSRADLGPESRSGPMIIEEYSATCVVPPGCAASVDHRGCLLIEVEP